MPGPAPKPFGIRRRRNKTTTRAMLPSAAEAERISRRDTSASSRYDDDGDVIAWHPYTEAWWACAWRLPQATQWSKLDAIGGIYLIAVLWDRFYCGLTSVAPRFGSRRPGTA